MNTTSLETLKEGKEIAVETSQSRAMTLDDYVNILDPDKFDHIQKVGVMLAKSQLIPTIFQNHPEDCAIAAAMAIRLRADPLLVLQNLFIIKGTPGFSAKFAIGLANTRGPFDGPIVFRTQGEGRELVVGAFGVLKRDGKEVFKTASMAMAEAEGWTSNKKYKSMPEQMLSYRAAMMLIRAYCPEVLMGMTSAAEENEFDGTIIEGQVQAPIIVEEVIPPPTKPDKKKPKAEKKAKPEPEETVDETPASGPGFTDIVANISSMKTLEDYDVVHALIKDAVLEDPQRNALTEMADNKRAKKWDKLGEGLE